MRYIVYRFVAYLIPSQLYCVLRAGTLQSVHWPDYTLENSLFVVRIPAVTGNFSSAPKAPDRLRDPIDFILKGQWVLLVMLFRKPDI